MAILTIPSITKGQSNVITLSKSELALNAKVVADSYFSIQTNWNKIIVTYQCDSGFQMNDCIFDASLGSPVGDFNVSSIARDGNWEVQSLTIMDFDNGYLKLLRGDLTVGDFDIVLSSVISGFSDTLKSGSVTLSNNNLTALCAGANHQRGYITPSVAVDDSSKGYLELNVDVFNGTSGLGVSQLASDPTSFSNSNTGDPNGGYSFYTRYDTFRALTGNSIYEQGTNYPSNSWDVNKKITMAFDATGTNIKFWLGIDGDFGTGNDPVLGTGGVSFPKEAGKYLYFSAWNNHGSFSDQFSVETSPTNTLSGFTYLI